MTHDVIGYYDIFFIVYVLAFVGLNLIALLIADFYQKKFNQPAPRSGFILSIITSILLVSAILLGPFSKAVFKIVQSYLLLGSSILSIYSAVSLHIIMKRVRK